MKTPVILTIVGKQTYPGQDTDTIELVTEGFLESAGDGWRLTYEESSLTGMEGVTTAFTVESEQVTLTRTGNLESQMVFREGVPSESLYQTEYGAMMVEVCATRVRSTITPKGGSVEVAYRIELEQSVAGFVEYRLDIRTK